jgi:SNF2 family DNA or RNA helicase
MPRPREYPAKIKAIRAKLGLTQVQLAQRLGVSFATVNRWENEQSKPSKLSWAQIERLQDNDGIGPASAASTVRESPAAYGTSTPPPLDFTGRADVVTALVEGERLSYGHLYNPSFATEISRIDPLPHQRIAVYDYMLRQPRLRFLLADDAGAGKTIMAGLYMREMLSRRMIRRILIVPPAGLVGNWERELRVLFGLSFRILSGPDAKVVNPFTGTGSDRVIVSVDTLCGDRMLACLRSPEVSAYDLVIFDEAHKLSASRTHDMRVKKTDRYRLAEALAGVPTHDRSWRLPWTARHLLLLTATPHMGKEYPYYALWRLLEPTILSTPEAFKAFPAAARSHHFIRRTKEEMLTLAGAPLYPKRESATLSYELTQGELSEQRLYDETTDYLRNLYNKTKLLNQSAARLVMGVFQRRLASSTYALLTSLKRRLTKLDDLITAVNTGRLTLDQLLALQRQIGTHEDVLDSKTADEEAEADGKEENELDEDDLLQGVIVTSLADLQIERDRVNELKNLAEQLYNTRTESKFDRLKEIITDPKYAKEKLLVFTEHRDTLFFLVQRLENLGYTGQVAQIHGGMYYKERERQVEHFRAPSEDGGARILVATDAAGEGINLQFCWIMVNWDVPWNPARLEQRMGRIHRYGQKAPRVIILNLLAAATREGKVLETLLKKLELIRKELKSDKVFDVIGRLFQDVSIKDYMQMTLEKSADDVARELAGRLTVEQVKAIAAQEKRIYGESGDVKKELPRVREDMERAALIRLMPGYVRRYMERVLPLVSIGIDGSFDATFEFKPLRPHALDPMLSALEDTSDDGGSACSVLRPPSQDGVHWVHPGEPVFDALRSLVAEKLGSVALRGTVLLDPSASTPYLFHVARISVQRAADPTFSELAVADTLETKLIGLRQSTMGEMEVVSVEHMLLLQKAHGLPPEAQTLAMAAVERKRQAEQYLQDHVLADLADRHKQTVLIDLPHREEFIRRGFAFEEAELAEARAAWAKKARDGDAVATREVERIKGRQKELAEHRVQAIAMQMRVPELIAGGDVQFLAHALVVPSSDPEAKKKQDADTERIAMEIVKAWEEAAGAKVTFVHTPDRALAAGLTAYPGFDILSVHQDGQRRAIEAKGRATTGEIEVQDNEWAKAANLRQEYWLYVVYHCATASPELVRVPDPFGRLLAKATGSLRISRREIVGAADHAEEASHG